MEQSNIAETSNQPILDNVASDASTQAPVEKMLPQSEVDRIVKGVKHKYDARIAELSVNNQPQTNSNTSSHMADETQRKLVAEEVTRHIEALHKANANYTASKEAEKTANEFLGKLDEGKSKYEDFDEVTEHVPFANIPHIVSLANGMDNTADIIYELSKNASKLATLNELIRLTPHNPELARREMRKLSESIKLNEQAKQVKTANEPLSRIQPSPVGADSGSRSVSDFRKIFRS